MRTSARIAIMVALLLGVSFLTLALTSRQAANGRSPQQVATDSFGAEYKQAIENDELVLAVVLVPMCSQANPIVVSSLPNDPSSDTAEHAGPYAQAKAAMMRRSPKFFGKPEISGLTTIPIPKGCPSLRSASESEIDAVPPPSTRVGWPELAERFGGAAAVTYLSLPGYSQDGKHAVVYRSIGCGWTCGASASIELEKGASGWVHVRTLQVSLS